MKRDQNVQNNNNEFEDTNDVRYPECQFVVSNNTEDCNRIYSHCNALLLPRGGYSISCPPGVLGKD